MRLSKDIVCMNDIIFTPQICFQYFMAIKLHFSTDSYDAIKYHFQTRTKQDVSKRNDKHFYSRLARHPDPQGLMVSNLSNDPKLWVGKLFDPESIKRYRNWTKFREGLTYYFEEELKNLNYTSFKCQDNEHPDALKKYVGEEISIDTLVICNDYIKCFEKWDHVLHGDPIWEETKLPLMKYKPFVRYDNDKIRPILKHWLEQKSIDIS